jgi:hypothetical protein
VCAQLHEQLAHAVTTACQIRVYGVHGHGKIFVYTVTKRFSYCHWHPDSGSRKSSPATDAAATIQAADGTHACVRPCMHVRPTQHIHM